MKESKSVLQHAPDLASFSETELCAHWKKCPRTLLNWRKAGLTPPHFMRGQQVRYLLSDIEAYEAKVGI
jgi:hypothetical protein